MITRYRMSIVQNNQTIQFDEILKNDKTYKKYKDKIVLLDIGYTEPEYSRTIEVPGDTDGGIITRTYRQKASVTITFGIYIYNTADRNAVCDIIKSMAAKGGNVFTSDKPGKALYNCVCEKYPEIASAKNWTDPLTMTFSTYRFPYWQGYDKDTMVTKTLTGKNNSISVNVPGNATYAPCNVEFVCNGTISSLKDTDESVTLEVNGTRLVFNRAFKQGNKVTIDYDMKGNIRVREFATANAASSTSILEYVMPKSDDRLLAKPGQANTIRINSLISITATFTVRGAWL